MDTSATPTGLSPTGLCENLEVSTQAINKLDITHYMDHRRSMSHMISKTYESVGQVLQGLNTPSL